MENYEIIVESSCDLNLEMRKKYGIYEDIIRGIVYDGDKETLIDAEWNEEELMSFFKYVRNNVGKVHTAFPTYGEFCRVVEPVLESGKDALIFVISSGLSGAPNAYRNYREMILEDYPNRKIHIVDTLKYASASGLLAIYAARNKKEGMSFEKNIDWVEENKYYLHEIGPMDDLTFLARSKRIKAGKAFFGSLIGVQPVADFTVDGKTQPFGTMKGDKAINEVCLQYMLKTAKDLENQIVIICHSARPERANIFKEQLLKVVQPKELLIIPVGKSCGPNIGPGLCSYFYFGGKLTEDREFETKIFEELKK